MRLRFAVGPQIGRSAQAGDMAPAMEDALRVSENGAPALLEFVVKEGYDVSRYPPAGL